MVNSIFAKNYSSRDNYFTSHLLHSCSRGMEISRRYQIPQNNQHKPSRSQSYCWMSLACYLKKLWRKIVTGLYQDFVGFPPVDRFVPCSGALAFSKLCRLSIRLSKAYCLRMFPHLYSIKILGTALIISYLDFIRSFTDYLPEKNAYYLFIAFCY